MTTDTVVTLATSRVNSPTFFRPPKRASRRRIPSPKFCAGGARQLLAQAVETEVAELLAAHAHLTTEDGRQRLVRHGHLPERTIQTGIGPVEVRQPGS